MKIFVPRDARRCAHLEWAEIEDGLPVHPRELLPRVRKLLTEGKDWATMSDFVLRILSWAVRRREAPVTELTYLGTDFEATLEFDWEGGLIQPWPEPNDHYSIMEGGFYYLFSDDLPENQGPLPSLRQTEEGPRV